MTDLLDGYVQLTPHGRWKQCRYRDNGDGTAFALVGSWAQVRENKPLMFLGKMHTVRLDTIRETRP